MQPEYLIEVRIDEPCTGVDAESIRRYLDDVLRGEGVERAELSVLVIGHARMQELNVQHLEHDYPTDVLSFRLDDPSDDSPLEGELIVSAEMALDRASEFGWSPEQELLYYLLHGMLHLCGFDDHDEAEIARMRNREGYYLERWKFTQN